MIKNPTSRYLLIFSIYLLFNGTLSLSAGFYLRGIFYGGIGCVLLYLSYQAKSITNLNDSLIAAIVMGFILLSDLISGTVQLYNSLSLAGFLLGLVILIFFLTNGIIIKRKKISLKN